MEWGWVKFKSIGIYAYHSFTEISSKEKERNIAGYKYIRNVILRRKWSCLSRILNDEDNEY